MHLRSTRADLLFHAFDPKTFQATAFDVTVADAHCKSNFDKARNGTLLNKSDAFKNKRYKQPCRARGWDFKPLAMHTAGGWSQDCFYVFNRLAALCIENGDERNSDHVKFY